MFKLVLEKAEEKRDQIANIHWIMEKAREFQEKIYFCFIDYAFDCVDHNKLRKILQEMGIPDHLTCLLRNIHGEISMYISTGAMYPLVIQWFRICLPIQGTSHLNEKSSKRVAPTRCN